MKGLRPFHIFLGFAGSLSGRFFASIGQELSLTARNEQKNNNCTRKMLIIEKKIPIITLSGSFMPFFYAIKAFIDKNL